MFLLEIALLPVIVLLVYIYDRDKVEKEPAGWLAGSFFGGVLITAIALAVQIPLSAQAQKITEVSLQNFYLSFGVAACTEELLKFLVLYLLIWNCRHFNEYFDGIVYAVFISLGFACTENLLYVFSYELVNGIGLQVGITRALFSVPAHFLFAVIMGYYFSLAKFQGRPVWNCLAGLVGAILVHGAFDFLLLTTSVKSEASEVGGITLLFLLFDFFLWRLGVWHIRHLSALTQPRQNENLTEN